ncbi:MAG: hypothetical protein KJO31_05035 [Gammaproteobacteria bacterium]|nr:hypothetical protein [Gammaproteobacteria bacterium]
MTGIELFHRLRDLELPPGDYAVFGSGPLAAHGIIDDPGDLDVLCRGAAWAAVRQAGALRQLPDYGVQVVDIDSGLLTFGTTWGIGSFDVAALIDTAEIIDGLPFVRLEHVVAYKRVRGSEKDRAHLAACAARGICVTT